MYVCKRERRRKIENRAAEEDDDREVGRGKEQSDQVKSNPVPHS